MVQMNGVSKASRGRAGERAVDGLLAGVGAGLVMMAFLILVGWLFGEPALTMISRFSLDGGPVRGVLLHLGVSGMYGLAFGLAMATSDHLWEWRKSPLTAMLAGLIYGSFLWLVSGMILLALNASPFATLPQPAFAIAHLVYGVTLGALVHRQGSEFPRGNPTNKV